MFTLCVQMEMTYDIWILNNGMAFFYLDEYDLSAFIVFSIQVMFVMCIFPLLINRGVHDIS